VVKRKIFIIDDSSLWRTALRDAFLERGYEVETGTDGLHAIKRIRTEPPDVILTDFFLPRVDGGRICDFVKSHVALAPIPVVIISGGLHGDIARERYVNANAVIAKGPMKDTIALCGEVVDDMFDAARRARHGAEIASVIQLTPREITNKLIKLHDYLDVLHRDLVDAIFEVDEQACIARVNPAGLALIEADESALLGRSFLEVIQLPPDAELSSAILAAVGDLDFPAGPFEHHLGERCFQSTVSRIHPRQRSTGAIILSRDVTAVRGAEEERARLQGQLQQSQQLESLGRLAGGVAHDINNVLAGILGLAQLVDEDLSPSHPLRRDVEDIIRACEKGSELTRNLLGFARRGKILRARVSVADLIRDVTQLLSRTLSKKISIVTSAHGDLPGIEGDPVQLQNALMNICLNAADALEGEGTITLHANEVELDRAALKAHPEVSPGRFVLLRVQDDGVGMAPETVERCLEPFYSTKGPERGTGLGLSMVYGTLKNHGGFVAVESSLGEGSTISLYLPEIEPDRSGAEVGEAAEQFMLATGKILLVDDDEVVRGAGKRQLEKLGYQVELAADGKEALERYRDQGANICLVILDLIMPVMDGEETFIALQAIDPDVRVLIASGYSMEGQAERLLARGARGFIQKPYGLDLLLAAMAEALC